MEPTNRVGDNFVTFILNGQLQKVSSVPATTSLNTYIREVAKLKGTKFMCREGGCGVCIVSVQFTHPADGHQRIVSVNSCMFPVYACHGMKVTTIEGIGSKKEGYHKIQSRLANFYGTQCGYCSPGWAMSMYSLLVSKPKITMNEIEESFGGNICRCTGYRPILDAFKSFASDRTEELDKKVADIEDLLKVCPKSGISCHGKCQLESDKQSPFDCVKNTDESCDIEFLEMAFSSQSLRVELRGGSQWYKVANVDEIFQILYMTSGSYMLVAGNTAQGIAKGLPPPDVFIDINSVSFLKAHTYYSGSLYVGGNTTLSDAIALFDVFATNNERNFSYLKTLARHIEKVANKSVRNVGTIAGNLMLKHQNREFQSDIFLILETVGAQVSVRFENGLILLLTPPNFLATSMSKTVIIQIVFPPLDSNTYVVKTFKIAPRAQNAVAYVNGGFKFNLNKKDRLRVLGTPTIVYGGISPSFVHAYNTENLLAGKQLADVPTLQAALSLLGQEVKPLAKLPDASPQYRILLTQGLLYRFVLGLNDSNVKPEIRSGGEDITRPLSSGKQEYDVDASKPPLYQPFPKLESLIQCSGEAEFVYDIPLINNDLYAALVITKQGPAELVSIDPSVALKTPGVVAFYSAKDIPGENTISPSHPFFPDKEQLFADKDVLFAGQQVGILVALTQEIADSAAELVSIKYKNMKKPVLDARQVVKDNDVSRVFFRIAKPGVSPKPVVKHIVKGEFKMDAQYHFTMETLSCVAAPSEDGLDLYCTTQWMQVVQETVALVLNIPENSINMKLRRLGGSYGGKLTRGNMLGGACSLAAFLLQRPVRIVVKLETVMECVGKRFPLYFTYEAGVDDEGGVQYMDKKVYSDAGSAFNDPIVQPFMFPALGNVYDSSSWDAQLYEVKTDKPCNVWTRAPGSLESVTMAEQIMEHIAHELKKDPLAVRIKNLDSKYPIMAVINTVKEKSDYDSRKAEVEKFNKDNVWKKRGISLVPMRYPLDVLINIHASVSIYRNDGTVVITHGGVEMGQGINTKAAQVCASAFNIPLDSVKVKPNNNVASPNNGPTGGSFGTDCVCFAVQQCCTELNNRLAPIWETLKVPKTWLAVIQAAYAAQINLNASFMYSPLANKLSYTIFGATLLEVEVDILTGEHKVIRVDIVEDAGKSLNQFVDIGQIEGAFVMGLGYWTSEELIHDPYSGRMLNNRTLKYKVPGAKDIPIIFNTYILKNSENPLGVLSSKAVGEPPICMSTSIMFAIRQALRSAREDLGLPYTWLPMDTPFTCENIVLSSGIDAKKYKLNLD